MFAQLMEAVGPMSSLMGLGANDMHSNDNKLQISEKKQILIQKFNLLALNLCKRIQQSLGLENANMLLTFLENNKNSPMIMKRFASYVKKNKKTFYFEETSFFTNCPLKPNYKIDTLKEASQSVIWKSLRKLFFYATAYEDLSVGVLDSLGINLCKIKETVSMLTTMSGVEIPAANKMKSMAEDGLLEALKNPKETYAKALDALRAILKKNNITKEVFVKNIKIYLQKLPQEHSKLLMKQIELLLDHVFE